MSEDTDGEDYCVPLNFKEKTPERGPVYVKIDKEALTGVVGLGKRIEVATPNREVESWGFGLVIQIQTTLPSASVSGVLTWTNPASCEKRHLSALQTTF